MINIAEGVSHFGSQALYTDGKNAIDEFVKNNNLNCQILCDGRFAKIEK